MKPLLGSLLFLGVLVGLADAQNPVIRRPVKKGPEAAAAPDASTPWSRVTPTESMWLYEQQKRDFLDPTLAMRRRAEYNAWQRRHRLAATRWYGYSNSRPNWNPTPFFTGTFSPAWTGNDYLDRYRWTTGAPAVVVWPESDSLLK